MRQTAKTTLVTLLALSLMIVGASVVSAKQGKVRYGKTLSSEQREEFSAKREAIQSAIDANDYNAWVELLKDKPKAEELVSEEKFSILVEAKKLRDAGDIDAARALVEDAGIKIPGHKKEMKEHRQKVREAVEANNYNAWAKLMSDHPGAEAFVTQETFENLVKVHKLKESGDKEGARELAKELGVKRPKMMHMHRSDK